MISLIYFFLCFAAAPLDVKDFEIHISEYSNAAQEERMKVVRLSSNAFELSYQNDAGVIEILGSKMISRKKGSDSVSSEIDLKQYFEYNEKIDFQKVNQIFLLEKSGIKNKGYIKIIRERSKITFEIKEAPEDRVIRKFYITYQPKDKGVEKEKSSSSHSK